MHRFAASISKPEFQSLPPGVTHLGDIWTSRRSSYIILDMWNTVTNYLGIILRYLYITSVVYRIFVFDCPVDPPINQPDIQCLPWIGSRGKSSEKPCLRTNIGRRRPITFHPLAWLRSPAQSEDKDQPTNRPTGRPTLWH